MKPADVLARLTAQAQLLSAVDGLASGGDAELAVDRYRLGLDRVPREVQSLADLGEGEVGGQQWEQPQLGGGERREPLGVGVDRVELGLQLLGPAGEDAEVWPPS